MAAPRLEDTLTAVKTFFEENPEESGVTLSQVRDMLIRMMGEKDAFHPGPPLLEAIRKGLLVREKRIKEGVRTPVYHYSLPGELALVTCQQLAERWDLPRRKIHHILSKRGVHPIDRSQKGHHYPAGFANEAVAQYLEGKSSSDAAPDQESTTAPASSEPSRLDRLQQKVAENISKVARDLQGINEEIDRLIAPLKEKRNALERELGELHESREQLEHAKALLDELEARL